MIVNLADEKEEHRPVDHRHLKIEEEQIVSFLQRQLEAVIRSGRSIHFAAQERGQRLARPPHQRHVIIHDQDFHTLCSMNGRLRETAWRFKLLPMEKILADLAAALRERLTIIADEESRRDPIRHTERLQAVSERIEQLEQKLPGGIDPQLRHFLQRRSYTKALELLEVADPA